MQQWVMFMKDAGVQSVVSMLSDSELATYAQPLPAAMAAAFQPGNYVNIDAKAAGETRGDAACVRHGTALTAAREGRRMPGTTHASAEQQ